MSETSQLINTLKKCLKAKGITYKQLADELNLSEASVKRLFSEQTFSIKRLEDICRLMDLTLYDLSKLSANADDGRSVLSIDQEKVLADRPKLLVYFYLLINGRDPSSIVNDYQFSKEESLQFLFDMDKLGLIELHPNNRVRLLKSSNIKWRKNGPIRQKFEAKIKQEFLNSEFDLPDERLSFVTGKLSEASRVILFRKIDRLLKDFNELVEIDKSIPEEKSKNIGLMVGYRPWIFSLIHALKR
ncbi:MAG: helix-turn-helix transcriptional regulator [Desulfobacterales bacterium]|nr:helix-turn-helix transcriptional regulator [Desulfobacterales bacterium]